MTLATQVTLGLSKYISNHFVDCGHYNQCTNDKSDLIDTKASIATMVVLVIANYSKAIEVI